MYDKWKCPGCGAIIYSMQVHDCPLTNENPVFPKFPPFPKFPDFPAIKTCDHCYCEEMDVKGKKHKKCCMCGHRKLANVA